MKIKIIGPYSPSCGISSPFRKGASGGASFISVLSQTLDQYGFLTQQFDDADILLLNSHHWYRNSLQVLAAKSSRANLRIVVRVDGPLAIVRGHNLSILDDLIIAFFIYLIADGSIFQSQWSLDRFNAQFSCPRDVTVIHNGVDKRWFYGDPRVLPSHKKLSIVFSSWSPNLLKGFGFLDFLDNNLDFDRCDLLFVGNKPATSQWENINVLGALDKRQLAEVYKQSHIYLFASELESCSNSLLEALASGLYGVILESSSNREIAGSCCEYFKTEEELINILHNYANHKGIMGTARESVRSVEQVTASYLEYFSTMLNSKVRDFFFLQCVVFLAVFFPILIIKSLGKASARAVHFFKHVLMMNDY